MKLIDGWRQSWRLWSVRLSALGALLMAAALGSPDALLAAWNIMPDEVRSLVPDRISSWIAMALFATTIGVRLIRQRGEAGDGE